MDRNGTVDVEERAGSYRGIGWREFEEAGQPYQDLGEGLVVTGPAEDDKNPDADAKARRAKVYPWAVGQSSGVSTLARDVDKKKRV
ncbi:MAG: hypothetical protein ACRD7E_13945 [Bryobacteraceae bacterium]